MPGDGDKPSGASRSRSSADLARLLPVAIGVATFFVFALTSPRGLFTTHTAFNHYALLGEGWLQGRLDLGGEPPRYTQLNDFALFHDRWFVSFPPFPALLLLPLVWIRGGADKTPDGAFFVIVASAAPAILYCALKALRDANLTARSTRENVVLALLLPFATVFWFSAVQGTVWFAAHAVGVALACGFVWASVRARHPIAAGALLVLAFATRPPMGALGIFFVLELLQERPDTKRMLATAGKFVGPIAIGLAVLAAYNHARFDDALEFGHRHLQVVWRPRMDKWGLFSLHYVGKNLGVLFGSTPFVSGETAKLAITGHGLAIWITSPFLAFALWPRAMPRRARGAFVALAIAAACIALQDIAYHNTGWVQFGYRFSNDFIVPLLAMLAIGRRKLGPVFGVLVAWSAMVNLFGALSFQRPGWEKYYRSDVRPNVYFEPD